MRIRKLLVVALALLVGGCQTWGPTWSEVSGVRYTRIALDRRPAILVAVGNEWVGSMTPYKVAPGMYDIVVQSPVHDHFLGSQKTLPLAIAPCRRYYINAQFKSPVGPAWTPVVDYVETIPGCRIPAR